MRIPASIVIIGVGVLSASCVQKSISPTSFSPSYKSMIESKDVSVVRGCAAASAVSVENGLPSAVVGKRTLEESSFPAQTISIEGDTVGWIRAGASEMFRQAQLKTGKAGAPNVKLRLSDVQINENVHVNAGYDARVTLEAAVVSAAGKECWSARKSGASQEYGDHGSAENYRTLVDHALDRAVMAVAADSGFQEALCSAACANAEPESAPAVPTATKKKSLKRKK
jgi:hypothetical protein